jgi:hypothetical protein
MKIIPTVQNESLREFLTREGFLFPCGGKGLCGRCRIIGKTIVATNLDRRFLSPIEIENGLRLACDKTITGETEIEVLFGRAPAIKKLEYPQIAAVLGEKTVEVSLIDEKVLETAVLSSPGPSLNGLRSAVGKTSVEFFEKYKGAKAVNILIAGEPSLIGTFAGGIVPETEGETYPAEAFQMPSEEVYLPPSGKIGSDILLELLSLPENSLAIFTGRPALVHIGVTTVTASVFKGLSLSEDTGRRAFAAAIKYYADKFAPSETVVVGNPAEAAGFEYRTLPKKIIETAASALLENKIKTKLNKLARKVELLNLAEDEDFQRLLTEN